MCDSCWALYRGLCDVEKVMKLWPNINVLPDQTRTDQIRWLCMYCFPSYTLSFSVSCRRGICIKLSAFEIYASNYHCFKFLVMRSHRRLAPINIAAVFSRKIRGQLPQKCIFNNLDIHDCTYMIFICMCIPLILSFLLEVTWKDRLEVSTKILRIA